MKNSTRAVLWSALVFPGSGQIIIGHRKRGLIFSVLSIACLIVMVVTVVRGTWSNLESIALQGGEITLSVMTTLITSGLETMKVYFLKPMILLWFINLVDAWYLGRQTPGKS